LMNKVVVRQLLPWAKILLNALLAWIFSFLWVTKLIERSLVLEIAVNSPPVSLQSTSRLHYVF
jgi:hypothetical protein